MDKLYRFIIFGISLYLFWVAVDLAKVGQLKNATLVFSAGFLCLVFVYLTRFKKVETPWLKMEMWEEKMEEAEKLINNLKSLSAAVGKPMFTMIAKMGRWGASISRKERYEIGVELQKVLEDNQVPSEKIQEAKEHWDYINVKDQAAPIIQELKRRRNSEENIIREELNKINQPVSSDDLPLHNELAERLRDNGEKVWKLKNIFKEKNIVDFMDSFNMAINDDSMYPDGNKDEFLQSNNAVLKDIKHYVETREFRRLNYWFTSDPNERES